MVAASEENLKRMQENMPKYQAYRDEHVCPADAEPASPDEKIVVWGPLVRLAETQDESATYWVAKHNSGYISHIYASIPAKACIAFGRSDVQKTKQPGPRQELFFHRSEKQGVLLLTLLEIEDDFRFIAYPSIEVRVTGDTLFIGDGQNERVLVSFDKDGRYKEAFEALFFNNPKAAAFKKLAGHKEWRATLNPYFMAQGKAYAKESLARLNNAYDAAYDQQRRSVTSKRWEMFGQGLNAFSQGLSQGMADAQRMDNSMRSGQQQAIEEGNRQYEAGLAAQRQRDMEAQAARDVAAQREATPQLTQPVAIVSSQAPAPVIAATRSASQSVGSAKENSSSTLLPTPEAIVVCTMPDTAGRFACDTPVDVNLNGGPKNDLVARRSLDSMIHWLSASCGEARRLPSTTHIVWGCGYGATGNSNTKDRSAGIDVQGRRTYYCHPLETSCRNASP
jgi:hypothetical protein